MYNNLYQQPRNYTNYPQQNVYEQNMYDQNMYDQIDSQIKQLQQMREQVKNNVVPTSFNQTIQLAPTNNGIKFVDGIEEVQKELTIVDTPFINKNYSMLWIKNTKGEIRTFNIEEIIPKDEKDLIIENLKEEIKNLKGMFRNEQQYTETSNEHESEQFDEPIETKTTSNVSNVRASKSKSR